MKRKQIICAGMLAMVIFNSSVAFATPLSAQLTQQQNQLEQNEDMLSETQDSREELEIAIQQFDVEIEETLNLIEDYKGKIKVMENEIINTEVEVK